MKSTILHERSKNCSPHVWKFFFSLSLTLISSVTFASILSIRQEVPAQTEVLHTKQRIVIKRMELARELSTAKSAPLAYPVSLQYVFYDNFGIIK